MALTTIDQNNKLIKFTRDINREYVRENMFSPYMGEELNAIIRVRNELKQGGETINLPIVSRLRANAVGNGTLVGNEERIDNYGQRVRIDWARNAVVTTRAEQHKDSADIFGIAKPMLSDWGKELQRDEIIAAMMALPTETVTAVDVRVNGTQYDLATTAQRDTWHSDNRDRILYGEKTSNSQAPGAGAHAASLATLSATTSKCTGATISLAKRLAMNAVPKIRPFKLKNGYEYFVGFCGTNPFRDLKLDLNANVNLYGRPREGEKALNDNPLFQDGDQLYDGIIVRQVPEITAFVSSIWTNLLTAGATNARVEPFFLCGQQAAAICWGQMARPTFRKEDDYGFITGTGIEMAYGVGKFFKKHPNTSSTLKQWGMVTGFFACAQD